MRDTFTARNQSKVTGAGAGAGARAGAAALGLVN